MGRPVVSGEPTISVVVPTFNTRELTLRCLASLRHADETVEVLLVDDGSTDDTAEAVRLSYPEFRVVRRERQGGFTAAANEGLLAARGALIFLLNSDAEVEAGTLSALRTAFAASPRLGIGGAALFHDDGRPQWSAGVTPTPSWLLASASGLPGLLGSLPAYRRLWPTGADRRGAVDWVSGAAMVLRTTMCREVGVLDDVFSFYGQDLDICARARDAGWEVKLIPEARVRHQGGGTIRRREGATMGGLHPGLLWTDLLRFVRKREGVEGARRAARYLLWGVRVRMMARFAAAPFVARSDREAWAADSKAYANGRHMVASFTRGFAD